MPRKENLQKHGCRKYVSILFFVVDTVIQNTPAASFFYPLALQFYCDTIYKMRKELMKKQSVPIRVTADAYQELKLLCLLNDKNITEMVSNCIMAYQEVCERPSEIKKLKHQIYRYKYDSYEEDK